MQKGTSVMLELLKDAKSAAIPAKYVLFDSWFSSPSSLHAVKGIGYDVIAMVKKTPKMFFRYNGEEMSLTAIYSKNKKRWGRSRYLLSVMVDVVKDGKTIPAKVVYVRNRNKRKEYLCIISTDTGLIETTNSVNHRILITESLPGIEFSKCITKIYVRSLSYIIFNIFVLFYIVHYLSHFVNRFVKRILFSH